MQSLGDILRGMFPNFFKNKEEARERLNTVDLTVKNIQDLDVLDPRGDGTIRPGDSLYDIMQQTMKTGQPFVGIVTPGGKVVDISEAPELEFIQGFEEFSEEDQRFIQQAIDDRRKKRDDETE